MTDNFKVETLVKTFKELQQEKTCLERKLKELREKRKKVESEDEAAFLKLNQVNKSFTDNVSHRSTLAQVRFSIKIGAFRWQIGSSK